MQDAGLYISLCLAGVIVALLWPERKKDVRREGKGVRGKEQGVRRETKRIKLS